MKKVLNRREFLKQTAASSLGVAAMSALGGLTAMAEEETESASEESTAADAVTEELDIVECYEYDRPEETEYSVDVLVVGCGFAGLNAAYEAKMAGRDVMVIDKGRPGYSGQSPWAGCSAFFDADMGDDAEQHLLLAKYSGEGLAVLPWMQAWIDESKDVFYRHKEWGIIDSYPRSADDGFWENNDTVGYREKYADQDRHPKFAKVLDDNGIPYLQHVMITNVIVQDGKCVGAVGFQVTTGTYIRINAKAVILATGGGCIMPAGHAMSDNTFDGEYIAYQLGLPITGKEYEDYHTSVSWAPGNIFNTTSWRYLENIWPTGGGDGNDGEAFAISEAPHIIGGAQSGDTALAYESRPTKTEQSPIDYTQPGKAGAWGFGTNPDEIRSGKEGSSNIGSGVGTGATGMCLHCTSGVWCGYGNMECSTEIPGLYVAGDGIHVTGWEGGNYAHYNGATSGFVSIDGIHAGKAAAAYCEGIELETITDENYEAALEEIEQPLNLERGFDPGWARDTLLGIMAPYWVCKNKEESTLQGALAQVEYMRDHVADRLLARNSHDLRLCHEVKHKILASELKLRASIYRKECRGAHHRVDYPYRNDEEYLGYVLLRKGDDGEVNISLEKVPEEYQTIDMNEDYFTRHVWFHYGELQYYGLADSATQYTLPTEEEETEE